MHWIGLTGSIGSGKSTVAEMLSKRGFPVVDADQFARLALAPGSIGEAKVLREFGPNVADGTGRLDRKKLADEVFGDSAKLLRLEAIVHPMVKEQTRARRSELEANGQKLAFYDIPLLFEKKMEPLFDGILVVAAEVKICVERVIKRSKISARDVEKRVRSQLAIEEKIKKSHWVINNNGTLQELDLAVENFLQDIGRKLMNPH